jgi:hypothetical protein
MLSQHCCEMLAAARALRCARIEAVLCCHNHNGPVHLPCVRVASHKRAVGHRLTSNAQADALVCFCWDVKCHD